MITGMAFMIETTSGGGDDCSSCCADGIGIPPEAGNNEPPKTEEPPADPPEDEPDDTPEDTSDPEDEPANDPEDEPDEGIKLNELFPSLFNLSILDFIMSASGIPIYSGSQPNDLQAMLYEGDVILRLPNSNNLGIFPAQSPFTIPAGRTLYLESPLRAIDGGVIIVEGTIVISGRFFPRPNDESAGLEIYTGCTLTIQPGGRVINDGGLFQGNSASTINNYGTIEGPSFRINFLGVANNYGRIVSNGRLMVAGLCPWVAGAYGQLNNFSTGTIEFNAVFEIRADAHFYNGNNSTNAVTGTGSITIGRPADIDVRGRIWGYLCIINKGLLVCEWGRVVETSPTCLLPGGLVQTCQRLNYVCNNRRISEPQPALGHILPLILHEDFHRNADGTVTPNVGADGISFWRYICSRQGCDYFEDRPIPVIVVPMTVVVTFDPAGGAPTPPPQTVTAGSLATQPATLTVLEGFVFLYWTLNGVQFDFSTPITGNITLVAFWEAVQPEEIPEVIPEVIIPAAAAPVVAPLAVIPAPPVDDEDDEDEDDGDLVTIDPIVPPLVEFPEDEPDDEDDEDEDEDDGDDTITIIEPEPPLAAPDVTLRSSWALLNLILTIAGAALAVMIGVRILLNKKEEKDEEELKETKHKRHPLVFAIPLLAIVGIILFIITQDMTAPMLWIDWWTLAHAILFTCGLISYIFAYKKDSDSDTEQPAAA